MLRIWAIIAGLYFFTSFFGGQVQPGRQNALAAVPMSAVSMASNPGDGTGGVLNGTNPVPQVMQVYVMSSGSSNASSGGGGNVTAAQSPGGLESQGTAFYLDAAGQKVIVAPYHAWVMAGASINSAQVYLAGQVWENAGSGSSGGWTWWSEQAQVLGADPVHDTVLLAVPSELKGVAPLEMANSVSVGAQLHGSGYAGGQMQPNTFSGDISYSGPETEVAGAGSGWQLNFQGYGLKGNGVEPGDSGSPALTSDGRVAGEVVASGKGWILVVPSTAIEQAVSSLPAA